MGSQREPLPDARDAGTPSGWPDALHFPCPLFCPSRSPHQDDLLCSGQRVGQNAFYNEETKAANMSAELTRVSARGGCSLQQHPRPKPSRSPFTYEKTEAQNG